MRRQYYITTDKIKPETQLKEREANGCRRSKQRVSEVGFMGGWRKGGGGRAT